MTGWFDVRVYNERLTRDQWKIKGEDDNIAFTTTFEAGTAEAAAFAEHGKAYTDGNGNQRVRVTFKIGGRCGWFDERAQSVAKPANEELDGCRWEARIVYNSLPKDPANPKKPSGYWANSVQFRKVLDNPFEAMPGAQAVPPVPPVPPAPDTSFKYQPTPQPTHPPVPANPLAGQMPPMDEWTNDDLPF